MRDTAELQTLAQQVREAFTALDQAKASVRADEAQRKHSWTLRIASWLFGTQAKRAVEQVEKNAVSLHTDAMQTSRNWVVQQARLSIEADSTTAAKHAEQLNRSLVANARSDQARQLLALADSAHSKLIYAADACASAHTTEAFDLFTKNKAISVLSSLQTSSASDAIKDAQKALDRLSSEVPEHRTEERLLLPSDLFDLIVDLAIAPGFDVLSWINMGKLSEAEDKCRQAADRLKEVQRALKSHALELAGVARIEVATLRSIEMPFIMAAYEEVPEPIRGKPPVAIPSNVN